jgi:hypothetical protein
MIENKENIFLLTATEAIVRNILKYRIFSLRRIIITIEMMSPKRQPKVNIK